MSRKSKLDAALEGSAYPPMVPHQYLLDQPEDWESTCSLLCQRHLHAQERLSDVCRDLGLDRATARHLVALIRAHECGRIGQSYVKSKITRQRIPPLIRDFKAKIRANEIGHAILVVARQDAPLVRHVISTYAAAVSTDRQIVLTPTTATHMAYARALVEFVHGLRVEGLGFRLVAYENAKGEHADLDAFGMALGLDEEIPKRVVRARNPDADSPARQVGLEVVRTTSGGDVNVDEAFFAAMILGAAVEAWRFAVHASVMNPDGQPLTVLPMPLYPWPGSELPRAAVYLPFPFPESRRSGGMASARVDSSTFLLGHGRPLEEAIRGLENADRVARRLAPDLPLYVYNLPPG